MNENILAPSILSANFMCLGAQIRAIENGGAKYLHFDVMDGRFVPNISFGIPVLKSVREKTEAVIDAHLMIVEPEKFIDPFIDAGADIVTFHYEATQDVSGVIDRIHARGKKAGVSIRPKTAAEVLLPYLHKIDMVLVMSVEPGFGGQSFIPESFDKIAWYRAQAEKNGYAYDIEVDGGIKRDNAATVVASGANILVAGSAVFKGDAKENSIAILNEMNR